LLIKYINNSFLKIGRNVKVSILIQPLWGVPFSMLSAYVTLYMTGHGLSEAKVGIINSAAFAFKAIIAIFAGYIVNMMGRKKSVILFDTISLVIPYTILIFATDFWQFLIANIIAGFGVVNVIAQHCYLAEDIKPEDRVLAYNLFITMFILSGFFTPVGGILVEKFHMLPAIRIMYLFALICSIVFVTLKILFLKETSIGAHKAREVNKVLSREVLSGLLKTFRYVLKNKKLAILIAINIAVNFAYSLYTIYYFLYLTQSLKYSESNISVFPFVTAIVSLITMIVVMPLKKEMNSLLVKGFILYIIGGIFLVAAPANKSLVFIIVNVVCWAISLQITNTLLQVKIANAIDDDLRADVMSFSNAFSMLVIFPSGIIGGIIYKFSPIYLFYLILFIYVVCFMLFVFEIKCKRTINEIKLEV
jgi:MFS transporter, DHA1 family, tetracycline resistance protein